MKRGKKPVIIVNNETVLKQLRDKFGSSMRSYFVHRNKPSLEQLTEICAKRGVTDIHTIQSRFNVARNIYRMYTNNISLFDSIILNTTSKENTKRIIRRLFCEEDAQRERASLTAGNKIFIIAGNAGSGKDYIIQGAHEIGCVQVSKHTSRNRNPDDGDEMICNGDPKFDLAGCDITYSRYGTTYGIRTDDILKNLIFGKAHQVIVCSDMDTITALKAKFGESVVTLYVHSDITAEEFLAQETEQKSRRDYIEARLKEFSKAHYGYIQNIGIFDKCLIFADDRKELLRQFAGVLGVERSELVTIKGENIDNGEYRHIR